MTHNNTQHTGLGRLEIGSRHVFSWKAGEPFPFRRYFGGKQGRTEGHAALLWCGLSGGTWTSDDCDINKYTKMDFDQTFIEMMRAVR